VKYDQSLSDIKIDGIVDPAEVHADMNFEVYFVETFKLCEHGKCIRKDRILDKQTE
jgi:hypothetical protein